MIVVRAGITPLPDGFLVYQASAGINRQPDYFVRACAGHKDGAVVVDYRMRIANPLQTFCEQHLQIACINHQRSGPAWNAVLKQYCVPGAEPADTGTSAYRIRSHRCWNPFEFL